MSYIKWNKDERVTFTGRNGTGFCCGVDVTVYNLPSSAPRVVIAPITSQGNIGRCDIDIPADQLDAFIAELQKVIGQFNLGMTRLGDRNYLLISQGIKMSGSYNPDEAMSYNEESYYITEWQTIYDFLEWVSSAVSSRAFGSGNYEERFAEFLESRK